MYIAEPGVTLTDYALTLESIILAWLLYRPTENTSRLRNWFVVSFCALGVASFAGGTSHGFIHDPASPLHTLVWNTALIAIGVSALAAWMIGARLNSGTTDLPWLRAAAVTFFFIYCVTIVLGMNTFLVAIIHYLPAMLFLLATFCMLYFRDRRQHHLSGVIGVLLTFAAAGVQQSGVGLHSVWFDHNAFYHLIQAVALLFLFHAARGVTSRKEA